MPYKDPQKRRELANRMRIKHKARVDAYRIKWRAENPDKVRAEVLKGVLKRQYGMTVEEFYAMEQAQMGLCAICGQPELSTRSRLSVDHNHITKKVRALLCHRCNSGLGSYRENIQYLQSAIMYLQKYSQDVSPSNHSKASE